MRGISMIILFSSNSIELFIMIFQVSMISRACGNPAPDVSLVARIWFLSLPSWKHDHLSDSQAITRSTAAIEKILHLQTTKEDGNKFCK